MRLLSSPPCTRAFSLVELSIVLVILGLLVGGVLSGKALIESATLRSQIVQIDSYRVATRAFKDKYFFLPGDLTDPTATTAGFQPRGPYAGEGDGNGVIQGVHTHTANSSDAFFQLIGEPALFWSDLNKAALIPGNFTSARATSALLVTVYDNTTPGLSDYFPRGKISGTFVYVGGSPKWLTVIPSVNPSLMAEGKNYFFLSSLNRYSASLGLMTHLAGGNTFGVKISQAYAIDAKVDDANPAGGTVYGIMLYQPLSPKWLMSWNGGGFAQAIPADSTTCSDNNNDAAATPRYSMTINSEALNCMLAFAM